MSSVGGQKEQTGCGWGNAKSMRMTRYPLPTTPNWLDPSMRPRRKDWFGYSEKLG
jgi:hypothetical protein